MIRSEDDIKKILSARGMMEMSMFKDFMHNYDLPDGMNPTHMKAMMSLHFKGPSPMSLISRHLGMEKGSFTPVANKLITLGYVEKVRSEKDRRIYHLSVTEKGTNVIEKFVEEHLIYIDGLFSRIDENEQNRFFEALDIVNETLKVILDKK